MKKSLVRLLLMLFALLLSCNAAVDTQKAGAQLLQTDRDFAAASRARNAAEAFHQYLAEDAMELPQGQHPVFGLAKIYESMKADADQYVLDWDPQRAEVARSGEMGWTWGTYTLTFTDTGGALQTRYGKYLNVWRKQPGGAWKVIVDMGNSSPAPENP